VAIRVSKKVLMIGVIVLFAGLVGIGGYIVWRINQAEQVTPKESEATNNCCGTTGYGECTTPEEWTAGWQACQDGLCSACAGGGPSCSGVGEPCADDADCCESAYCNESEGLCHSGIPDANICDSGLAGAVVCPGKDESVCAINGESGCVWCGGDGCRCKTCPTGGGGGGTEPVCAQNEPADPNWCGEGWTPENPCTCGRITDNGERVCATHASSGCAWIDGACVCNVASDGGSISGSCSHFCNNGTAECVVATNQCSKRTSTREECEALGSVGTGCGSGTIRLQPGECSSITVDIECGVWQVDGAGCGWACSDKGCNWSDDNCEDQEPYCGDGFLDDEERCEVGDPTGVSCSWATCDHTFCTCQSTSSTLQIQGQVFCQDDGGERYPIDGAYVYFYKDGNRGLSESLYTVSTGFFQSAANLTKLEDGGFAVRYGGLRDATKVLPTGVLYSEMTGPVLENPNVCTMGLCDLCGVNYEMCGGFAGGAINYGFRWRFSNCSTTPSDWTMDKEGALVCYEEGTQDAYAQVEYTISVTNISGGGTITSVVDEVDDLIQDSWIISTNPEATSIENSVITWTLTGDDAVFTQGEEKLFKYTVRIPKAFFGDELSNHATARTSEDEILHAYEDIFITCGGYEEPDTPLPRTGLFDSTATRIGLGVLLVGMAYAYYKFGLLDGALEWMSLGSGKLSKKMKFELSREGKKNRWEKKVVNKVENRRRRKK